MAGDADGMSGDRGGASGVPAGTSGVPAFGYAAAAIGTFLVTSMNVWSGLDGRHGNDWRIAVYEYTSTAVIFALLWPLGRLVRRVLEDWPLRRGRAAALLLAGLPAFALAHVWGFVALRTAIFAAFGMRYDFDGPSGWAFEFPKEIAVYAILVMVLGATTALARRPTVSDAPAETDRRLVLREGGRVIHVRPAEVAAVSSAGNYVEYHLVDGRKPLVRGTLSACEAVLGATGFVRSHRSWLVNIRLIEEIEPAGSGDRRLLLSGGVEAPLSRRFADGFDAALTVQ
ncbi:MULTISPECIES: LytTR family DNA-binding domain-containing protein [unclassified Sphingomonas]|uniref:LytTR family DNA-binding domain-containing protein n=1 Tax=unclassified Sphingomonas TaxID=196159 RepID=UPI001AD5F3FB|nr:MULTISPECIES: LytTR family DNA-binding domain-containing protein [unclassified Sphingomonas]MBN8847910.1 response regulator transcription factor [Sphingomonas sp.]